MACSLPVSGSIPAGVSEYIRDFETGMLLHQPSENAALAAIIRSLSTDPYSVDASAKPPRITCMPIAVGIGMFCAPANFSKRSGRDVAEYEQEHLSCGSGKEGIRSSSGSHPTSVKVVAKVLRETRNTYL